MVDDWRFTTCENYVEISSDQKNAYQIRGYMAILSGISILCLVTVAMTIMSDKRLQQHPQPMIACICVVEAVLNFSALIQLFDPTYVGCYFNLHNFMR